MRESPLDAPGAAAVTLFLDSDWLRRSNLELTDTPGLNHPLVDRTAAAVDALDASDIVIAVVSGASPLSATERSLLEQLVAERLEPALIVAVTMLDRSASAERASVLRMLRARIASVSPHIAVEPRRAESLEEPDAMADLRDTLERLSEDPQRRRSRDTAGRLVIALRDLLALAERGLAAGQLAEDERRSALRNLEYEVEIARLRGATLRDKLRAPTVTL